MIRSMQNGKSKRRVLAIVVPLLLATIIVGGVGLGIAQTVLTLLKPSIFDVPFYSLLGVSDPCAI